MTKSVKYCIINFVAAKAYAFAAYAQIAQLVEQRTENPRVGGSIPSLGTICGCGTTASTSAFQAEDEGSTPFTRFFCSIFKKICARVAQW